MTRPTSASLLMLSEVTMSYHPVWIEEGSYRKIMNNCIVFSSTSCVQAKPPYDGISAEWTREASTGDGAAIMAQPFLDAVRCFFNKKDAWPTCVGCHSWVLRCVVWSVFFCCRIVLPCEESTKVSALLFWAFISACKYRLWLHFVKFLHYSSSEKHLEFSYI